MYTSYSKVNSTSAHILLADRGKFFQNSLYQYSLSCHYPVKTLGPWFLSLSSSHWAPCGRLLSYPSFPTHSTQITSDFVAAATKGAVAVVDGNVMAINPGEDEKYDRFAFNNRTLMPLTTSFFLR